MGKPGKEKDKWCWEFSWGGGAAADLEGCTHLIPGYPFGFPLTF